MGERRIIHVDMDAFFAAVEILDNPDLAGKPVIVGGTPQGRGVVSTASYEARKFGVHSAMSAWRAVKLCPNGIFLRPRSKRYSEVSKEVFDIFRRFTPLVEPISIDEAFLDVTGCEKLFGSAIEIGRKIKELIKSEVKLTASVGVAPNKFLAKLGSDLEKPDGFVVITNENAQKLLADLPVGRMLGVGKKSVKRLESLGIRKVSDLLSHRRDELEMVLGQWAHTLLELARGHDTRPVTPGGGPKSIGAERTFATNIGEAEELHQILDKLVDEVAARLRKSGHLCRTVTIKARYPDFSTHTRSISLKGPTARTHDIRQAARILLDERLKRAGRPLRLFGVQVSNLIEMGTGQLALFQSKDDDLHDKLDEVRDQITERFGKGSLSWANLVKPKGD